MTQAAHAERLITITDVDVAGVRRPVLATSDPIIVEAVERAVRERVSRKAVDEHVDPVIEPVGAALTLER